MTQNLAIEIMGSIGVVSLGCSVVGHNLKPGRWRSVLLTVASIGPLDVVRAWKLWASAIPLAMLCLLLPGCNDPVTAYSQQQQTCVAEAGTRVEAQDCIRAVRKAHCGPGGDLNEAGLCSWDGGAE